MVSVQPNPHRLGQDLAQFCKAGNLDAMKIGVNANFLEGSSPSWNAGSVVEDPNKKIRKPYTITKSRESWSEQEHDKFLEALHLFDRDWKKIMAFVGSKTVIQIRSHAQKYFMKVLKNGKSEHVPPPRPKRKATHPYPQKALKNETGASPSSAAIPDSSMHSNSVDGMHLPPWASVHCFPHISGDEVIISGETKVKKHGSDGNNNIHLQLCSPNGTNCQVKKPKCEAITGMPDFAQVYSFIASVFDSNGADHLQRLKKMDPINVCTVLMLMKNLSTNLMSPEFEYHRRRLLSSDSTMMHFA